MSQAKVAIIMGSKSDLEIVKQAQVVLEEFGIETEMRILSAHRCPEEVAEFSKGAIDRGVSAIIAAAGGAAHLPGVVAAFTRLPVIGIPIKSAHSIDGLDSMLSIAQMPSGVPVATVAVDGAKNAGILAAQMIGIANSDVAQALVDFKANQNKKVLSDDASIQEKAYS